MINDNQSKGWVKIHRQLLEWEWYSDINTTRLYLHLLLRANHLDKKWMGVVIKKGSLITGRKKLSAETGLSEQQIRSSLKKLKSTNEITIKTTNLNSLISIVKWNKFQSDNQQTNQQITNEQPTNNQQITTNKNVKNVKNVKNIKEIKKEKNSEISTKNQEPEKKHYINPFNTKTEFINSPAWDEQYCLKFNFKKERFVRLKKDFVSEQDLTEGFGRSLREVRKHFLNWIKSTERNNKKHGLKPEAKSGVNI